jgi:hypothetical protein
MRCRERHVQHRRVSAAVAVVAVSLEDDSLIGARCKKVWEAVFRPLGQQDLLRSQGRSR